MIYFLHALSQSLFSLYTKKKTCVEQWGKYRDFSFNAVCSQFARTPNPIFPLVLQKAISFPVKRKHAFSDSTVGGKYVFLRFGKKIIHVV